MTQRFFVDNYAGLNKSSPIQLANRQEVWLSAFCAHASKDLYNSTECARAANTALREFDATFYGEKK